MDVSDHQRQPQAPLQPRDADKRGTKGLKGLAGSPGGSADQPFIGNSVQKPVPKNFGDAPAGNSDLRRQAGN